MHRSSPDRSLLASDAKREVAVVKLDKSSDCAYNNWPGDTISIRLEKDRV